MTRLRLVGLVTLLILQASSGAAVEAKNGDIHAYVTALALNVRSGPGMANPVVGVLLKYDPVLIVDRARIGTTTWYAVDAGGGYLDGWVSAHFIAIGPTPIGFSEDVDYGEPETPTLVRGSFQYVGVAVCKGCHTKTTGDFPKGAYPVWADHFHSFAYESLNRAYTKVIAKRLRGIENPQTDWRCVKCHVTAYGADPGQLAKTYKDADGVSCEVCHGPGGAYAEVDHGPSNPERYNLGFQKLTNLDEREAVCVSCHNPASPTYKPFHLEEFSAAILHWVDPSDAAYHDFAIRASRRREVIVAQRQPTPVAQPPTAPPAATQPPAPTAMEHVPTPTAVELRPTATVPPAAPPPTEPPVPPSEAPLPATEPAAPATHTAAEAPDTPAPTATAEPPATLASTDTPAPVAPTLTPTVDEGPQRTETARALEAEAEAATEAALQRMKEEKEAEKKRQEQEAAAAEVTAEKATGVGQYLVGLPEVFTLNPDGVKYQTVRFTHAAHSAQGYVPGITCQTCHHTLEGDEKPEKCIVCHDIDGDAGETKKKTNKTHSREYPFPMEPGQDEVSCHGCHRAQNALLEEGGRSGNEAPVKCTGCHKKKAR